MSRSQGSTLNPDDFLYSSRQSLKRHDPDCKLAKSLGRERIEERLASLHDELGRLQELLYAEHRHKILIVLQGLDTSGKDGTIKHVFRAINPQGVRVVSFKKPTPVEEDHDYLWRIHENCPARGEVVIFNRSHYEDVVVPLVHRILPARRIQERYEELRQFEQMLVREGGTLFKMFLNISSSEQAKRIEERLCDPEKHWKFSMSDLAEREYWKDYQRAYDRALSETDCREAPWHVIPANHKRLRDLIVSSILVRKLQALRPRPPRIEPKVLKKLESEVRRKLRSS